MTGRVVVITGASSGIGLATALAAAAAGDHLVLIARGRRGLDVAAAECRTAGAASVTVSAGDVADAPAMGRIAAAVLAEHGRIDAVIHSAGVVAYGRFEDVPPEIFDRVVTTNLLGSANLARTYLPIMRDRDHGHLVLLGSLIGQIAPPYMSPYSVSKWGIRVLARSLVIENRDRPGVHITCVSPGGVDTPVYVQGGNYLGRVGRPPPPIASPEKVAAAIMRVLDHPRDRVNVGAPNPLIAAGFTLFPKVFDAIVTPMFEIAALDQRHRRGPDPGNVLSSGEDQNRLHGQQGSVLVSMAAGVLAQLKRRRPRSR